MSVVPLEICVDCSEIDAATASIHAALEGGASRVELCAEMARDGLTPAGEYCMAARRLFGNRQGVLAMIRPHAEGFVYSPSDLARMLREIEQAAAAGADGVVFGPLTAEGAIDAASLKWLSDAAHGLGLRTTFHRAFDALRDPAGALRILLECRIERVLTAGTPFGSGKGIAEGIDLIGKTIEAAGGRIEVVCAGGIGPGVIPLLRPLLGRGNVSVHAYSGVLRGGRVDARLVRELSEALGRKE